jgi:hypothetical protein
MSLVLTGSTLGAVIGLAHAVYIFNVVIHSSEKPLLAIFFAIWTLGLWIVFGFYVVSLWVIGTIAYVIFKAFR